MSTPVRVAAFVVGLAAIFGFALGLGRVADPGPRHRGRHADGLRGAQR